MLGRRGLAIGAARDALLRQPEEGVNVAGIRAVVAQIYLDPVAWNQNTYFGASALDPSRVAYCFAAWTCLLMGMDVEHLASAAGGYQVQKIAQAALGLSRQQANALFWWGIGRDEHPTVEDLKARVTEITGVIFDASELTFAHWMQELAVPC